MTKNDHFYKDQKAGSIAKCSHLIKPLKQSNQIFPRKLKGRDDTAAKTFHDLSEANMSISASFHTSFKCSSDKNFDFYC